MAFVVRTGSEEATHDVGRLLSALVRPGDVVLLSGDLGAGKTAFVKGLGEGLGIVEPITSPTFNILLVHPGTLPLYHVDLYRLENPAQLDDIDYFGTLEAGGVTAVEWGDRFPGATPPECLEVRIEIVSDTERRIGVEGAGPRGLALAREWRERVAAEHPTALESPE